jgi:hypothetical protein
LAFEENVGVVAHDVALANCHVAFFSEASEFAFDAVAAFGVGAQDFSPLAFEVVRLLARGGSCSVGRCAGFVTLTDESIELA